MLDSFPLLYTDRLDLIEINQKHREDLFTLFSDPHVIKYYNLLPFKELHDGQKFIDWYKARFEEKLAIRWGIALKGNKNIIGTLGFNNFIVGHKANIGYDLQSTYWNHGYITEALQAIIGFGFYQLDLNRIEAEVMQGNIGSEKVLEKLNFTKEGILRQWMWWNGKHYDMTMFSLLKGE